MDNYKNIGKKIKEERETLKLTQKELAKRAGIDFRFLGNIERGVSKPSLDTVVKIAQALDMPLDILVSEHIMHKNPPENSAITKEIVRLISMLDDFDALRVLQLIRYSIELFTGNKVSIPNEIQSHLKDERTVIKDKKLIERLEGKTPKTKHKVGVSRFWEEGSKKRGLPIRHIKNSQLKHKKTKQKKTRFWLV